MAMHRALTRPVAVKLHDRLVDSVDGTAQAVVAPRIHIDMRALVHSDTPHLKVNHAMTGPAPGEAVVRLMQAGLSRIDRDIARGRIPFHGVLGRECVGVVEAVAAPTGNGETAMIGRRVVPSCASACGTCDLCHTGLSAHCRHRTIMGLNGRDGCLAERFIVPVRSLQIVPDKVDDDHAVFAVQLASAMHAARQLTITGRPFITVLGDGAMGLLAAQVMARLNASVRLIGKHSEKTALCEKWGIKHRLVGDVGLRADQDVVVDCTGSAGGIEAAIRMVRPRGTVLLKSMHADGIALDPRVAQAVTLNEIEIVGSAFGSVPDALAALQRREFDVLSLISRRMKLADGPALFNTMTLPGVVKVLVDP